MMVAYHHEVVRKCMNSEIMSGVRNIQVKSRTWTLKVAINYKFSLWKTGATILAFNMFLYYM